MNILWIVNTIFPYPAEKLGIKKTAFGGWLNSLSGTLKEREDINLGVASVYNGKDLKIFDDGKIKYYLVPSKSQEKYWKKVSDIFIPDIVHINGTEYNYGLKFIKACPNITTLTSIQGLVSVYEKVYYANIPIKDILKNITFRDIVRNDNIIHRQLTLKQNFILVIEFYEKNFMKVKNGIFLK